MTKRPGSEPPETTDEASEYDAFEVLAKKLFTVSKKDLDEARAREDAEKQ